MKKAFYRFVLVWVDTIHVSATHPSVWNTPRSVSIPRKRSRTLDLWHKAQTRFVLHTFLQVMLQKLWTSEAEQLISLRNTIWKRTFLDWGIACTQQSVLGTVLL